MLFITDWGIAYFKTGGYLNIYCNLSFSLVSLLFFIKNFIIKTTFKMLITLLLLIL
jgi:hypothetical protein